MKCRRWFFLERFQFFCFPTIKHQFYDQQQKKSIKFPIMLYACGKIHIWHQYSSYSWHLCQSVHHSPATLPFPLWPVHTAVTLVGWHAHELYCLTMTCTENAFLSLDKTAYVRVWSFSNIIFYTANKVYTRCSFMRVHVLVWRADLIKFQKRANRYRHAIYTQKKYAKNKYNSVNVNIQSLDKWDIAMPRE